MERFGLSHLAKRIPFLGSRFELVAIIWVVIQFGAVAQEGIILTWMPTPNLPGCGYAVYYGTTSGLYDYRFDTGNNIIATVTNLTQGTTYFFAVVTVDSDGNESTPSNEVSYSVPYRPPAFNSIEFQNGQLLLSWNTVPGRAYQIEFKEDLIQSPWQPLGDAITATGQTTVFADDAGSHPQRFYRISVLPDRAAVFEGFRE